MKARAPKGAHRPRQIWQALALALVCYLLAAGTVIVRASLPPVRTGLSHLTSAEHRLASDPSGAAADFSASSQAFSHTFEALRTVPLWARILTPIPPFRWQVRLLKASHALSDAGALASNLAASFPKIETQNAGDIGALLTRTSATYFTWQGEHAQSLADVQQSLDEADTELQGVPSWIPLGHGLNVEKLQSEVHRAAHAVAVARATSNNLHAAFGAGDSNPHNFLVIFQNDAELRPTGGFMGSYAVVTASSGTIRQFQFGTDIYKLDTYFKEHGIVPKFLPLQTLSNYEGFKDSNVGFGFLDEAAPNIATIYEKASGTRIDGAIFLDVSILEDVLRLTGPVDLPGGKVSITSDNVRLELTQAIEKSYFEDEANRKVNEPKTVINDLIPVLTNKAFNLEHPLGSLGPLVMRAVDRKSLQAWARQPNLQQLIAQEMPMDHPLPSQNWVKLVNTNLGGQKSSRSVTQDVVITQKDNALDGTITEDITVTRTHHGKNEWPDADNRNLIEIYIPVDATVTVLPKGRGGESLLTPTQLKTPGLSQELWTPRVLSGTGWRKVSFWATTPAGQTTTYHLEYTLPLTQQNRNFLTYIKQAGSSGEHLSALGYDGPVDRTLRLAR